MKARSVIAALRLLAVLLAPLPARTQGVITGVTPDPSPGLTCSLNTITVHGTGSCDAFLFDLGDGTKAAHLPGQFPLLVYHTYTRAGLYSPTATGLADCLGDVGASLQVVGPTITSMFPFSVIKPGGGVIVEGQHFGNLPGQLLIHLNLYQGPGYFGGSIDVPLENLQWADTFVAGTIPTTIAGVLDQEATLTVVASCGATSNPWSAYFTAARDYVSLEMDRINCMIVFAGGPSDQCQWSGGQNWPIECGCCPSFGLDPGDFGIYGYHASGWGGGCNGYDWFWATLNNQWVVASVGTLNLDTVGNTSTANVNGVNPAGGTPQTPQIVVQWHADACGAVQYYDLVSIAGPVGVPY